MLTASAIYCRTCQECGHVQMAKDPATYKSCGGAGGTEAWRDVKCRKCKSAALDYGSDSFVKDPMTGKLVKQTWEEEE